MTIKEFLKKHLSWLFECFKTNKKQIEHISISPTAFNTDQTPIHIDSLESIIEQENQILISINKNISKNY